MNIIIQSLPLIVQLNTIKEPGIMNIAGVVILYNPGEGLIERMNSYKEGLRKLIVLDNSETKVKSDLIDQWGKEGIYYLHDGINAGIAKRLNQAAQIAKNEKHDWLLTMDQDSSFKEGDFLYYLDCLEEYNEKEKVAQFGVAYEKNVVAETSCLQKKVTRFITSGSIINLAAYQEIGLFDENLFIDGVDTEYCLRAYLMGFFNIQFLNIKLQHPIGNESYHRSFKNFKKTPRSLHNPERLYYMVRNYFYIRALYKDKLTSEVKQLTSSLLYHIKNNLLYSNRKTEVIQNVVKGIRDFRHGKFGKIKDEQ